ncbi:transmembrane protein, putative (macronuclear) [Tetrahymena thermophila SB210]|uniref:Transmembrane protein, putative n=1 Tax=Tetrahymena thermophila (strain SB210) TaxID=312017 RepID=W7X2X1_TETTS|nr:transmembrane protein, putative [Tetrahymena thermophila SB210]EWS73665.1 transmembrane protein, putative [Tetrahymena thermophila SB210]|eukprot:XP_012653795.1 transmembrane protein, putative [Tetrahymena thermophila SB210]
MIQLTNYFQQRFNLSTFKMIIPSLVHLRKVKNYEQQINLWTDKSIFVFLWSFIHIMLFLFSLNHIINQFIYLFVRQYLASKHHLQKKNPLQQAITPSQYNHLNMFFI